MAQNVQQFEQLIGNLMSPDNNVRGQAEAVFNESKKAPEALCVSLIQVARTSQHEQIRKLSVILLRRVLSKGTDSLWPLLSPQAQETIKTQLLQGLQSETSIIVRSALNNTVGHLGGLVIEKGGQWNELLPFMLTSAKSEDENHRETALAIFSDLASNIGDKLKPHFPVLRDVLVNGLNDKSLKVKLAALDASANFLHVLNDPQERAQFQQLTPLMLGTLGTALNEKNEEDARASIEVFVDLAEIDPTFLRPHLAMTISAMLQISSADHLEDDTKNLALEFLITLAENKPSMIRKYPNFLQSVLPIVLKMMSNLDDDLTDWNGAKDDNDDEVEITNSDIAEESLDRIAIAIGGKALIPVLSSLLPTLLQNQDWRFRHTGLMSLSIVGEGCHKVLSSNLPEIIKLIVPFFGDAHPRVRWAACNTVGQMSTDFGPNFQTMFHASVVPALISVMDDASNPRVQSHAASAIINFCEHCKPELLAPYLDPLLSKLLALLQTGKTIVQEQAITAIAAIADCAEQYFGKYYDTFMPLLKSVLANAQGKDYRLLRGKAMECISLIGVAVGKEKFIQDAKEVMDLMLKTQSMKLDDDDPQISFLLQSWARVCRCLGMDFVPYLPHVMPPLLASAKIEPDIKISDLNDNNTEEQPGEGWDYIPIGDKRIGIHTSGLEEKSTACNMLYCYASELKDGFFPYVEEVAKILVPLVKFYYHDGVRAAAFTTMPHLLTSASLYLKKTAVSGADAAYVKNLFNYMFPLMLESMREEVDMEVLAGNIAAFNECITIAGEGSLTVDQIKEGVKIILDLLEDLKERRDERFEKRKEEDHDDEEEERIEDEAERDDEILSELAEIVGHFAKYHRGIFLPLFAQEIMPTILEYLKPTSKASDRQVALCVFDDLVEHCGVDAVPFYQHFLPSAISYVADEDPSVRQAAVFGMGCAAQGGAEHIGPAIPQIASKLTEVITSAEARSDKYVMATENAIGAVGKIIIYQSKVIDLNQIVPLWLSWLPVKEDNVESKVTYGLLLTLVESNGAVAFGANLERLPLVLSTFGEILETDLIDDALTQRIKNVLRQMQANFPADVLTKTFASLSPQHQQKLQKALSS